MRIAIFARPPIPGRCKTRLSAVLGEEGAAALAAAFMIDTLATCRAVPELAPELHVAEAPDHPFFLELCARFELAPPILQVGEGLGTRMARSLGDGPALLLGTDAPTLPVSILRQAIAALVHRDVVLAPVADGGFVLVGARAPATFLEGPIRWSSPHALADTMRAARAAGLGVALTSPHYDVDEPGDLRLLRAHLTLVPGLAPATSAALPFLGDRRPGPAEF